MRAEVLSKVFEHAEMIDNWCKVNGGERAFTALFGSQNYNLDTKNSDVDTKSVIIPKLEDWTWEDLDKYNTILTMPDGSHAEIKCLPDMCKQYIKCNINFLETLYTEYVDVADNWAWLYSDLLDMRDKLSTSNMYKMGKTWLGYLKQSIDRAFGSASISLGYNPVLGYNPKSLMTAMRIKQSFYRFFMQGYSFDAAIDMSNMRDELLQIKTEPVPYDNAIVYREALVKWSDEIASPFIQYNFKDKNEFDAVWHMKLLCKEAYGEKEALEKGCG